LTGYLPATSGTARIAGHDVHEDSMAVRKRIGYLPETPPLYPDMTVEGFLYFVARIKGVPAGDRASRVQSALNRCNLTEKRQVLIRKLSKGFRQRVGIAQAIVHDPPAIILDEPTVGLDPRQIIDVRNLIKSLAGEHTIILSTHILPEVSMTCSRVAIINKGHIVATNTPDQLVAQLAGATRYELEVEGDFEGVHHDLRLLEGVQSVEALALEDAPEHRYRIRLEAEPGTDPGRAIAATVVGAGLGLFQMRRSQVSLEDVFLQLTTEEKIAVEEPGLAQEAGDPERSPELPPVSASESPTEVQAEPLSEPQSEPQPESQSESSGGAA
jgi:ABC-2 type transport system ATP-binding protein